jgi:hypothetical protein
MAMLIAEPFHCSSCGCPSVSIEPQLEAETRIRCFDCGEVWGTWSQLQQLARSVIGEDPSHDGLQASLSADPLPVVDFALRASTALPPAAE